MFIGKLVSSGAYARAEYVKGAPFGEALASLVTIRLG
jgi:hypothetical protein